MRIMAFGPHPDDVEFLCAGTLAKYAANGHKVAIVVSTNGEVGSSVMSKAEISVVREKEARESAGKIGAEFYWMGYPDEFLFNSETVRIRYIDIIRQFRPDLVICPDKDVDYHPDHIVTGQIVWDTHVMVTVPNIKTEHEPCLKMPDILFMDTIAAVNFYPEFFVDITDYWDIKVSMIECHKSQEGWMMNQYDVSCAEFGRTQSRLRGFQSGCKYAECFRMPKFFPGTAKLKEILV
jgi:LmbE family N-acetylglucosaminyl deacetylase